MSSYPKVSCIIPTMNRPVMLGRTLTRLFDTTKGLDVEAVVVVDGNVASVEIAAFFAREHPVSIDYSPVRRRAIDAWNIGMARANASIYFHQGDDLDYEDGWLQLALDAHREKLNGYGLVGVNDSMHDGNVIATHALWDRQFCIDHLGGVMATPTLLYYGVDNMFNERAKRAGRFYWCKESVVRHIHPANNGREVDETDRYKDPYWEPDMREMARIRAAGYPNDFEPVLK